MTVAKKKQSTIQQNVEAYVQVNDEVLAIAGKMEKRIAKIRDEYNPRLEELMADDSRLRQEIYEQAEEERAELFGDKQSCEIGRAKLTFRVSEGLEIIANTGEWDKKQESAEWDAVLAKAEKKATDYVVTKPQLDRNALKKAGDKILKLLGLEIRQKETFSIKID